MPYSESPASQMRTNGAAGGGKTWKTQTKYDTYPSNAIAFRGENQFPSSYNSSYLKGKVTTTITKIEGSAGRTEVISTPYYDDYGRVFETASQSHVAAGFIYDIKKMDFVGRVLRSRQIVVNGMTTTVEQTFSYERSSKIKSVCQKVNTELWQPVGRYAYNGIGEMTQKTLGCKLQVLSYKYDLRSRMIALNNPANLEASKSFFGMSLAYDEVGNINKQTYRFAQRKGKHTDPFAVIQNDIFYDKYEYDAQNRLSWSKLSKGTDDNIIYKLDNMSYDANGNIKTLERWWQGQYKDRLVYDYGNNTSNRLLKVDDSGENNNQATEEFFTENSTDATDFTYDDAGNMITDANKDISLTYNYLNLVKTAKGNSYTYTATGQKNRMVSPAGTFDYIGSVVFKNNEVEFIATPEGRVLPPAPNPNSVKQNGAKFDPPYPTAPDTTNKYWRYEYDIKDHLGNLRVACRCAEQIETAQTKPEIGYAPTVVQQAHYDPWGVKLPLFSGYGGDRYKGSPEDRFKYNGKEQQPDIGYYDYGARMYDPTTGRWFGIDPLALLSCNVSPYTFVKNDPINYIDIGGEFRFPKQIREDFPLSVELLERILNDLSWAPAIINSLAKYTGLSQSAVKKDFMTDFGPEIDYLNTDTYGFYTPTHEHFTLGGGKENKPQSSGSSRFASLTDQKNEITLILNELETSIKHYKKSPNVDNKNDMKQKTLMVVISALHEYCHYGIYKTGNRKKIEQIDKGDDEGTGWERLYLGKRVESDRASITNTQTTPKKIWENGSNNSTVAIELLWFISRANNESQKEKKTEKRQTRNPGDDE